VATVIVLSATVWIAKTQPPTRRPTELPLSATPIDPNVPLGLPPLAVPADNPVTAEKVALGKRLFFDKDLSLDRSLSCASCHDPAKGWSNGLPVAAGVNGATGNRNVPTILNAALNRVQFWDGRAFSLEAQAVGPILNPVEMAMPSADAVVARLQADTKYREMFSQAFPDGVTIDNIARSLATFQRTILSGNAPYDRFQAGDKAALSAAAQRGLQLFSKKAGCSTCHTPPLFNDIAYHNIGVGMDRPDPDPGRYSVTKILSNFGAFKSPTLRDISKTAPYMHDGSMATLEEVIEYYDKGGNPHPQLSREMRKLQLTKEEKRDLLQFLVEGLTSSDPIVGADTGLPRDG
jgi:cytochrome c peroxidase